MCPNCYNHHATAAEQTRCDQAQQQSDAIHRKVAAKKLYADLCFWCGSIHRTPAERAKCMLDNCG